MWPEINSLREILLLSAQELPEVRSFFGFRGSDNLGLRSQDLIKLEHIVGDTHLHVLSNFEGDFLLLFGSGSSTPGEDLVRSIEDKGTMGMQTGSVLEHVRIRLS